MVVAELGVGVAVELVRGASRLTWKVEPPGFSCRLVVAA